MLLMASELEGLEADVTPVESYWREIAVKHELWHWVLFLNVGQLPCPESFKLKSMSGVILKCYQLHFLDLTDLTAWKLTVKLSGLVKI